MCADRPCPPARTLAGRCPPVDGAGVSGAFHRCGAKDSTGVRGFSCLATRPYCDEGTGKCGNTQGHKDAQTSRAYDYCGTGTTPAIDPRTFPPTTTTTPSTVSKCVQEYPATSFASAVVCIDTNTEQCAVSTERFKCPGWSLWLVGRSVGQWLG